LTGSLIDVYVYKKQKPEYVNINDLVLLYCSSNDKA